MKRRNVHVSEDTNVFQCMVFELTATCVVQQSLVCLSIERERERECTCNHTKFQCKYSTSRSLIAFGEDHMQPIKPTFGRLCTAPAKDTDPIGKRGLPIPLIHCHQTWPNEPPNEEYMNKIKTRGRSLAHDHCSASSRIKPAVRTILL